MLLGNHTVLNKGPGRAFGGPTVSDSRANYSKSGPARGCFYGDGDKGFHEKYGLPGGYVPPYSFVIPQVSGGLGSNTLVNGNGTIVATGYAGLLAAASLVGVGSVVNALGALVVSAVATIAGTGTLNNPPLVGIAAAIATLPGTGTLTDTLTALGNMAGTIPGTGTFTAGAAGPGSMSASISPFTTLSPESLANAVWAALATDSNKAGSMGSRTNFLYMLANYKVVTDPSTGTMKIYDTDNTTVLFTANLYADAAGATPYAGTGAERRNKFA